MIEKDVEKILQYIAVHARPNRPYIFGVAYEPPPSDHDVGRWCAAVGWDSSAPDVAGYGRTPAAALHAVASALPGPHDRPALRVVYSDLSGVRAPIVDRDGNPVHAIGGPVFDVPDDPVVTPITARTRYTPDPDGPDGHVIRTFNPDPGKFTPEE